MEEEDEKELEKYIIKLYSWEKLPPNIKKKLENSTQVWKEKVIKYSIKHQLRWKNNLVRSMVPDERLYYQEILRISKMNLMLYPYHIADVLVKGLRVTPFKYYSEMMQEVLQNEYPYDRVPNFTASDCVRLLGIGRNEFIEILNKCRSKGWIWKTKKTVIKDLLPTSAIPIEMEHWWIVNVGFVSEEDIKNSNEIEHSTIDLLIDSGPKLCGELDKSTIQSLHTRGLIYIDVPIFNDDHISVPPLENFVMNRVAGDYFENLLYKIFVSTDERTSVEKLSAILDIDTEMVKQAISMYCRLGFAKKKSQEIFQDADSVSKFKWHSSWLNSVPMTTNPVSTNLLNDNEYYENESLLNYSANQLNDSNSDISSQSPSNKWLESTSTATSSSNQSSLDNISSSNSSNYNSGKRVGFIVDYTLTALLMMGNLAPGLKSHAVTMYEVGKLSDETIGDFLFELDKVSDDAEGEAQRYHDHAITLRQTIRFLRKNEQCKIKGSDGGLDILRTERLNSLDMNSRERILHQNYSLIISMAPITNECPTITSTLPYHFGPSISEVNSSWFSLYIYNLINTGPPSILYPKGYRVRALPNIFKSSELVKLSIWNKESTSVSVRHLLPILNDLLLESAVLVQAYSNKSDPIIAEIPFPIDFNNKEELGIFAGLSSIKKLHESLHLELSFGYIKMVQLNEEWIPFELHYGIPLHNAKLNTQICQKIQQFNLFSDANLQLYSKQSRELCIRLLDFIAESQKGTELELDFDSIPFPSKLISFVDGKFM